MKDKTKQKIKVIAIGTPDVNALTESERTVFYTTLLKRLTELAIGGK